MRAAPEKAEMRLADKAAALAGFISIHFSQPRRTMQTLGIPDRLYLHPDRGAAMWWEAKAAGGRLSPHQAKLHDALRACGQMVVVGDAARVIHEMEKAILRDRAGDAGQGG